MSLTATKFGKLPSSLLGLDDPGVALDFDNAAAMRQQQYEDERLKSIIELAGAAMWGAEPKEPSVEFETIPIH